MADDEDFKVLPISLNNPDIEMIGHIEKEGISFLIQYIRLIEEGTKRDKFYYKSYVYNALFEDLPIESNLIWKQLANSLKTNKEGIELINHIHSLSSKKRFIEKIIQHYDEADLHKLLLNESVIPYFSLNETALLDEQLEKHKLNIKPFIKCAATRNDAMEWLMKYYNDNKRFKSLLMINVIDIYNLDTKFHELTDITMQLLDIFQKGITKERICGFKFPTQDDFYHDDTLKYINKYFFMLNNFLELSVLNILTTKIRINELIEDIQRELDSDDISSASYNRLLLKVDFFKNLQDKLNGIVYNKSACFEFYRNNCIVWMNHISDNTPQHQHHELVDNILTNVLHYITIKWNSEKIIFDEPLFNLCMKILNVDENLCLTSSIVIKAKTMVLISTYFEILESGVKLRILSNLPEFVRALVPLYISVATLDDYDSYVYQLEILRILVPYKQVIFEAVDDPILQKFVYYFLDTYHSLYQGFIKNVLTFYKIENFEPLEEEEAQLSYDNIKHILKWYQKEVFVMDQYIAIPDFQTISLNVGNRDKLALVLGFKLQTFVSKDGNRLEIHESETIFKPIDHLKQIFDVVYSLCEKSAFQKAIAQEERFLKTEYLEKMVTILIKNNLILANEHDVIIAFKSKIELMRKPCDEDEDIPDDLLDPIMGSLIENPVLLPNTDTFIDQDVILRHLLTSSDNPFTRDPLSKTQLEEYNARPEIQVRIGLFKQRLCNKR